MQVGLTHFNMATFFGDGDPSCNAQVRARACACLRACVCVSLAHSLDRPFNARNWAQSQKPSAFAPTALNISNWIESCILY